MTAHKTALPVPLWRPLRLATLVRLRWLAIVGQAASVLIVALVIGFPLPLTECLALIGLSAGLNLFLSLKPGVGQRLTNRIAAVQLGYDLLQLGALLWLTGGLQNPFSLLLLAPVSVSATTLTQTETLWLSLLAAVIASGLAISHLPLPWDPSTPLQLSTLYIAGIWVSLLLGVAFIAAYTNRVAHEARQLADALAATELTLSRQQQLSALDGLAAAAAHELGTPLSTIALAAKEMRAEMTDKSLIEDADLIVEQAARCRAILTKLRDLESGGSDPFTEVRLNDLVAEVVRPHETPTIPVRLSAGDRIGPEPIVSRNVGLLYGLGNLIENAVQFSHSGVEIETGWASAGFDITITDDGAGFPPELIASLGEPYLTTRGRDVEADLTHGGLGLGIFIAKTLLERTGAQLTFANTKPSGYAQVTIRWPYGLTVDA